MIMKIRWNVLSKQAYYFSTFTSCISFSELSWLITGIIQFLDSSYWNKSPQSTLRKTDLHRISKYINVIILS